MRTKEEARKRLVDAEAQLAEALPFRDLKELAAHAERAAAAVDPNGPAGMSALTDEELPSASDLRRIRFVNLRRAFAERQRILQQALTVNEVAELFGKGRQYPHDRRKAGSLIGMKDSGQWFFPAWQFDPEGPDGVIAGLPGVVKAMRGPISDLGQIRWFVTPKPLLEGRTPLQALADGDVDEVIAEAESIGAS
jgi:hypothetical protein